MPVEIKEIHNCEGEGCLHLCREIRPITIVKVKGVCVYVEKMDCTHGDEG
jgi:hypothetical protein